MIDSLRRTRLFVAVYEERSFTGAAAREFSTQSGVSQHIQKLEEQLGVRLFVRQTNSVAPTPAGDAYYAASLRVLTAHEEATRIARSFATGADGTISVGLTPTVASMLLAPALAEFTEANPNVIVRVVEAYATAVVEKVVSGELDLAVVPSQENRPGIRCSFFARSPEFLVASVQLGLKPFAPVRLADLGSFRLVMPSSLQTRRRHLDQFLSISGAQVERRLEIDTMLGTLQFVELTDWVTILPAIMMVQDLRDGRLTVHPIVDPPLELDIFEIHLERAPLTPVASEFLAGLRRQADLQEAAMTEIIACQGTTPGPGARHMD